MLTTYLALGILSQAGPPTTETGYLSVADYIVRFGRNETRDITTSDGVKTDYGLVETAIDEASALADAYIGTRYPLPLASKPSIVVQLVADLARERLFTSRPTDEVTARAERARAMLKDIAKGVVTLIVGDAPAQEAAGDMAAFDTPAGGFGDFAWAYRGLTGTMQ